MGSVKLQGDWSQDEIQDLRSNFGISSDDAAELTLVKNENQIQLKSHDGHHLCFDFDLNRVDYHRKTSKSSDPLLKALGYSKGIRNVIDLSMGLAIDSLFLAQNGFTVTSIERHPLMALLVRQAQKNSTREFVKKIDFVHSSAQEFLKSLNTPEKTAAYFDPMFPHKKKSALPRQEMVFFRKLVGSDDDASETLALAISKKFERVVVKRPLKAPALLPQVSYTIETKLMRFDVYKSQESS